MPLIRVSVILFALALAITAIAHDRFNTLIWKPSDTKPWFEWWYYKVVLPESGKSFYVVYGVVNPWDKQQTQKGSRSYVGFGNFADKINLTQNYPVNDFQAASDRTDVWVHSNHATDTRAQGEIVDAQGQTHHWDFSVEKNWRFNAMGWGMYVRNLTNIGWYPAQADASCSGSIESNGVRTTFQNAPCYQDRNWGRSFPSWWAWIVSNHFENSPGTVLAAGGGLPKVLGQEIIDGLSIGLHHKGQTYSFRPTDLNWSESDISLGKWKASAVNLPTKIELEASAPLDEFMDLQFITPEGDVFHDYETLTGTVRVKLYHLRLNRWVLTDDLVSHQAGIEYGSR